MIDELPKESKTKVNKIEVHMSAVINVGGESIILSFGADRVIKLIKIANEVNERGYITGTVNAEAKKVERTATGKVTSEHVLRPLEFSVQCFGKRSNKETYYALGKYMHKSYSISSVILLIHY